MKRAFIWISSALLSAALLLMGGANAPAGQEPYPCGPGYGWRQEQGFFRGQQAGPHFMRRFETIDQDHDGVVTVEEAAGNVEFMFSLMDEDEDNSLSLEEFMSVRMGSGAGYNPSRQEAAQARKEARFGIWTWTGTGWWTSGSS